MPTHARASSPQDRARGIAYIDQYVKALTGAVSANSIQDEVKTILGNQAGKHPNAKIYIAEIGSQPWDYKWQESQPVAPASTAKIVTIYLVLKAISQNKLTAYDSITIPTVAVARPDATTVTLRAGQKVMVSRLIREAMTRSTNDAAIALAYAISPFYNETKNALPANGGTMGISDPGNVAWFNAFGALMTKTAKMELGAPTNTNFCNPAGFTNQGSGGCVPQTTAKDMANIASNALIESNKWGANAQVGNQQVALSRLSQYFAPATASAFTQDTATMLDGKPVNVRGSTFCGLYRSITGNTIDLVKSGTASGINGGPEVSNLVAAIRLEQAGCTNRRLVISVMGLTRHFNEVNGRQRDSTSHFRGKIVGDLMMLAAAVPGTGRYDPPYGSCKLAYDWNAGQSQCGTSSLPNTGTVMDEQATLACLDMPDTEGCVAMEAPATQDMDNIESAPAAAGPGNVSLRQPYGPECDENTALAEQRAATIGWKRNTDIINNYIGDHLWIPMFQEQCLGKFFTMMDQFRDAMQTANAAGGNILASAITIAIIQVARGIIDQVMVSITQGICNYANAAYNYLDSVTKNALCMPPLFKVKMDPLKIGDLGLDPLSCSGLSVDFMALYGGDPNAQIFNGSIAGVTPSLTQGQLPFNFDTQRRVLERSEVCGTSPVMCYKNGSGQCVTVKNTACPNASQRKQADDAQGEALQSGTF